MVKRKTTIKYKEYNEDNIKPHKDTDVQCVHCGQYYSKQGIRLHTEKCKKELNPLNERKAELNKNSKESLNSRGRSFKQNKPKDTVNSALDKYKSSTEKEIEELNQERAVQSKSAISEVNLMSEFEAKKQVIEPQKPKASEQEEKPDDFRCGSCQATFTKKHKFCPECGIEFE